MKRVFALILCFCMVLTMVPAVSAQTINVSLNTGAATTYYSNVEQALAAAEEGNVVTLLTNLTAGQVIVPRNVRLDLNGFTLTADMVIVVEGCIADSTNGIAKLIVDEDKLGVIGDQDDQLLVWDPEDHCYVFGAVQYQQILNLAADGSYAQYIFIPNLSGKALDLLKDGGADNGIRIKVCLSWNDGASQQYYTFSDEMVAQVYGSADANGYCSQVFMLTITGIANIRDMTVYATAESAAGDQADSGVLPAFGDQGIVDQAYKLGANETLPYEATLTGVITDIGSAYDSNYQNITVTIAVEGREDKPIVCYRMKGNDADRIGIDDVITVSGNIRNYVDTSGNSTVEYLAGCQMTSWTDNPDPVAPSDPKQIVDEAYALEANKKLKYKATLTGTITKIDSAYNSEYQNITVTFAVEGREDKPIVCYLMTGDGIDQINTGDTITVVGFIKNYVNQSGASTIEYDRPALVSYEKSAIPADPKQIVDEAYALSANAVLPYEATLTGKITQVKTSYNATYGNITVIITVAGREEKPITCYRMKGVGADQIGVNDTVTVTGTIKNYVSQSGNSTIEFDCPTLVSYEKYVAPSDPAAGSTLTVEEAIALGLSKEHNAYTSGKYYVTGVITEVYQTTYGNMRIADEAGNILTVYGTYSADGTTRYDAMSVKPVTGDTVTIYGVVGQYNGAAQIKNGWITEHIPYVPEPEPDPDPTIEIVPTCDCAVDDNQDDICDNCQAHIHRYTVTVIAPNCTQEGYTTHLCVCRDSYVTDRVPAEGKHIDANKDKVCDLCSLSVIVELDFYSINDLHGAFMDTNTHPGVDEFTTYMKQKYQDADSYEILLSAGDMWQGSVESSQNKGALMTDWMNELDFVSMTIGNHEYDWGSAYIARNSKAAEFPILGINVRENGVMPDYCQPSTTVERGGVKIGIIGAMGNHVSSISGEFNQNLQFLSGTTLTTLVKNEATRLRNQEGCDLIVYVIHDDDSNYDTSLSNGYVDLVFEAHSHQSYINTDTYGVTHIQSGGYNEAVSFVNIAYNLAEDTYVVETVTNLSNSVYGASSIQDDPFINNIFNTYFPGDNPYTTVLGRTAYARSSSVICQEIADQYLAFGEKYWSQYDIVLAGGYLKLRDPYKLYAGNITYAQLYSLMPFDNSLVLGKISGSKLKSKFIDSSTYYITQSDSMPTIQDSKTYYIVVDTYTAYYASNGITVVDRYDNYYARDIIADFVKAGGWS